MPTLSGFFHCPTLDLVWSLLFTQHHLVSLKTESRDGLRHITSHVIPQYEVDLVEL